MGKLCENNHTVIFLQQLFINERNIISVGVMLFKKLWFRLKYQQDL